MEKKLGFRERLRLIQEEKETKETPIDLSTYKVVDNMERVLTKYDWVDAVEKYQNHTLGGMTMEHLRLAYEKRQALRESKEEIKFYPSSIGRCKRMITYQMLKYPATPKAGSNLHVLETGTSFHERMEELFSDMGILVVPELAIKDEGLCISGRTDAVVWNFLDDLTTLTPGEIIDTEEDRITLNNAKGQTAYVGPRNRVLLIELKTIKDSSFHKLRKKSAKNEHIMQLQLYFHLTGIEKGLIYYENKNTQEIKEYVVEKDDDLIAQVLADISYVVDLANKKELADREFQPNDVQCRYCDYRELCYPNLGAFDFNDLFQLYKEKEEEEGE